MIELPGGGKAWFVRIRRPGRYSLNPCAPEGWAVTLGYCLAVLALTLLLIEPNSTRVIVYAALFVTFTLLFCVVAYRMSAPEPTDPRNPQGGES